MQTNDDEMTITKAQARELMEQCGNYFVELYTKICGEFTGELTEKFVFAAMAAALGVCAMKAEVGHDRAMKLLTSIFDEDEKADRTQVN